MRMSAVVAVALSLVPGVALAASGNASTVSGAAAATIVAPVLLAHDSGAALNFGTFTTGTGGTVTASSAGKGSVSGDVGFTSGSTVSADAFVVTGEPGRAFVVSTTSGAIASGGTRMAFTTVPSAVNAALDQAGSARFTVGGTLVVTGTEAIGHYTGTYVVNVSYN